MGFLSAHPAPAIAGAVVVSFVVSFALMWHGQRPTAPVIADRPPAKSTAEGRGSPIRMSGSDASAWAAPLRPASVSGPAAPPPAKAAAADDDAGSPGPVPVAINVFNRRNRHRIEGYVANTSNKPLSVTLEVVGGAGRGSSTLQLDLPVGGREDFSTDSGLDMRSNDQIVVHCDPYLDVTAQVP